MFMRYTGHGNSNHTSKGGMIMRNQAIRQRLAQAQVKHWQLAEAMSVSEFTLSRRLRHELPAEEQARILDIIDRMEGNACSTR